MANTSGPIIFEFSVERYEALEALESISTGRGWCNVVPSVEEDVPDHKVSFAGLWVNKGVATASFVTFAPRHGIDRPSSLGLLHSRGRLGKERTALLLGDAPFTLRQDHSQRGLLYDVPTSTPMSTVLESMCSMTTSLCDFAVTGSFRLDLFLRS